MVPDVLESAVYGLLISRFGVRVPAGAPALTKIFTELIFRMIHMFNIASIFAKSPFKTLRLHMEKVVESVVPLNDFFEALF